MAYENNKDDDCRGGCDVEYIEQRKAIIAMGRQMIAAGLAVGTWGNISCRVGADLIAITPSGVEYTSLQEQDIVVMSLDGQVVDGNLRPSTEHPLHRQIYRDRPDVAAVVHSHSVYASAMACARKPIPAAVEDLVQIVGGDVPVADYHLPGTQALATAVSAALARRDGVLLANHGVVGVGATVAEALRVCAVIEKAAHIAIVAQAVGGVVELEQADIDAMRSYYKKNYGQREGEY